MPRFVGPLLLIAGVCTSPLAAQQPDVAAPRLHVDVALDQSFTSVEPLASPLGFRLAFAADGLSGRWGVQLIYRRLWEPAQRREQLCHAFFCEQGPFDVSHAFAAFGLGVTLRLQPTADADLILALNGSLYRQIQTTERVGGPEGPSSGHVGPNPGIGTSVELRFPAVIASLRPMVFARYDFIAPHPCLADASCWGSRHVASLGVGAAWTIR